MNTLPSTPPWQDDWLQPEKGHHVFSQTCTKCTGQMALPQVDQPQAPDTAEKLLWVNKVERNQQQRRGFQARSLKRSGDLGRGRWSWTLNFAQKRSWVGRWRWAGQVQDDGLASSCPGKLFVNSGATDIVLVTLSSTAVERAIAQCTSRWAMARGHRLTSIVLAVVHGLSGLFRAVSAVEPFTLSSPSHSVPVLNRPSRLRGR